MVEHHSDAVQSSEPDVTEDDKLLAILAYVPILCLMPFTRTDRSDFVTGHVRLGMTLFIVEIFALILRYMRVVWDLVIVLCIIGAFAGILHVVRGRRFVLPYVSDLLSRKF
jgi:ascorbate-specific PTS system EIIC-type component UlaA